MGSPAQASAGAGPGQDGAVGGPGSPGGEPIEEIPPREERFRPAPGEVTSSWLTYESPPGAEGPRRVILIMMTEW
jgi:hypothetical protein